MDCTWYRKSKARRISGGTKPEENRSKDAHEICIYTHAIKEQAERDHHRGYGNSSWHGVDLLVVAANDKRSAYRVACAVMARINETANPTHKGQGSRRRSEQT